MTSSDYLLKKKDSKSIALTLLTADTFEDWLKKQSKSVCAWCEANTYKASPGSTLMLADKDGGIDQVLVGVSDESILWDVAGLPSKLPKGAYHIKGSLKKDEANQAVLGWALGCYRFDWYKDSTDDFVRLAIPKSADDVEMLALASGIELTRDLINIPASDLGPVELTQAAMDLAEEFGAKSKVYVDDALLKENFPAVYAVGKGASEDRRPHLVEFVWGKEDHPKITLVGKGVCFDTGGLDIKPAQFMKLMKKDMGGAAHVLGLARTIMMSNLPMRLRVIVPAVENAVSDKAMRPLDVVESRKGLTIEIGHTDAEGRVILADALTLACEDDPELVIDFATLTGAARVALGTEVPALFTNDDGLAAELSAASLEQDDPLWRLPLHKPYKKMIEGKCADLSNEASAPYGGAITAALFLEHFIEENTSWAHLDVMGWNLSAKPGRPEGGEAMAFRSVYGMLKNRL